MSTLIDSYSEANKDTAYYTANTYVVGQTFKGNGSTLDSCKFYLSKNGSPTQNCYAELYAHTGTFGSTGLPTGSVLATSDAVSASTVSASFGLITFTFSGADRIELGDLTDYVLVMRHSGVISTDLDYLSVGVDTSSSTHEGNLVLRNTISDAWSYRSSYDTIFYVYGVNVAPTVTTQNASSITHNSAVANGTVTSTGGASVTRRGFCYIAASSGDPTTADSVVYSDGTFSAGAYQEDLTGLSASTDYRVRAYAVNSVGTSYGATVDVTTTSVNAPVVSTTTTTLLKKTIARVGGNVTDEGTESVTERGIYYSTDEFTQDTKIDSTTTGEGAYPVIMSGLTADTTYYYKAYATSTIGTSYGDVLSFTTGGNCPVLDALYALPPFTN